MNRMIPVLALCLGLLLASPLQAKHEAVTIPVVLADYYGFAYYQAFRDHAYGYAYPTAAVDLLGWGIVALKHRYSGMFLVNMAGLAKTVYPLARLAGKPDRDIRRRAWVSVGTHAGSLLWLKLWSKPELAVTSWVPDAGGNGLRVAWAF